jgi:hypothetical protein
LDIERKLKLRQNHALPNLISHSQPSTARSELTTSASTANTFSPNTATASSVEPSPMTIMERQSMAETFQSARMTVQQPLDSKATSFQAFHHNNPNTSTSYGSGGYHHESRDS